MKTIGGAALLCLFSGAYAQTGPAIEWVQSGDRLSNGGPNWHGEELHLSAQLAPRNKIDGTLRRARRFDLSDSQVEINVAFPLSGAASALLSANGSASHRFLPKSDLGAGLQYELAPAWLLNAGAGQTEYDNSSITKANFAIEHYFSSFRLVLGWKPSRAEGVPANGADIRLDYYYGDRDFVGLQSASGREATNVDGRKVIVSSVRSAAINGRHGLSPHWMLRYGMEKVKQGNIYNRTGIHLGAQYVF